MSYRPHPAQDVIAGSRWISATGKAPALVRGSAEGYVDFTAAGVRQRMHHEQFRREYLEPYASRQVRSQFAMCIANLQAFHAFWSTEARRIFARSIGRPPNESRVAARGSPAVPAEAIYIGTYSDPFTPEAFLADLNDALATAVADAARSAAA